jgi:predicted MFS family arabinose efflux permease
VVAVLAFVLTGLAKVVYDPAIQAYVGDRVPYSRRGLAIGVIEVSWSAGLLLGVPLVGFAIQRFGWSSPFVGLALLAVLGGVAVLRFIRPDAGMPVESRTGLTRSWGLLLRHPVAIGALGFAVLIGVANENMFVVYGEWMELSFGLQVSALGLLTAVIGVAELSGELIVATGSDRTGKRRLMLVGLVISALAYAGLPRLDQSLFAALVALFVMFIGFEAAVVSSIPLVTELLPAARGTMMGAFLMAFSIGRTLGALVGDVAWRAGGFALNGLVAAGLNVLAILLVLAVIVDIPSKTGQVSDATG